MRFLVLVTLSVALSVSPAAHATPAHAPETCQDLAQQDFSTIPDAPTQVMTTKFVQTDGPGYCQVEGYVAPQVGFAIRLPVSNWNGKFMEVGCGGWCGSIDIDACETPVQRGYACIATDMGHKGAGGDLLWAYNNLQAQIDFGYRATHVAALAGKAIANRYYQKPADRSYFIGCSTGGYQGVTEAQRFPWDFDGIIAGAPDIDEAAADLRALWIARSYSDASGKPLLRREDLELLHQAVLERCDLDDGVKDGVVGNAATCRFDPRELICPAGQTSRCLTEAQVTAAQHLYEGPMNSKGNALSPGGLARGSELLWEESVVEDAADLYQFFRYGLYGYSAPVTWAPRDFDFDRDYKRLSMSAWFDNTNPDLRRFKAAGGKLIVYHGGNDTVDLPRPVVDYYETVERTMGGSSATRDFFRLYIVPGMNHCTGGDGAYAIDYLSYMEAWIEKGKSPDKLIGAHVRDTYLASRPSQLPAPDASLEDQLYAAAFELKLPLDTSIPVSFTRPVYPYPTIAKYSGYGDPNDAASFIPVEPMAK